MRCLEYRRISSFVSSMLQSQFGVDARDAAKENQADCFLNGRKLAGGGSDLRRGFQNAVFGDCVGVRLSNNRRRLDD